MSNLIPTNGQGPVEHLYDRVSQAFDRWLPWRSGIRAEQDALPAVFLTGQGPAIEVTEDAEAIQVTAELPGLHEKDFTVELMQDRLILRGEKKVSREEKRRDCQYSECSYGSFSRVVPLPCEVDPEKIAAHYKHGVLSITLPKTEAAKAKRIKVNVA